MSAAPVPASTKVTAISIYLTPYAPGVAQVSQLTDPGSWITCFHATPVQACGKLLERLGRDPSEVQALGLKVGETAILSARPGETRVPLAFVLDDVPPATIAAALQLLAA